MGEQDSEASSVFVDKNPNSLKSAVAAAVAPEQEALPLEKPHKALSTV